MVQFLQISNEHDIVKIAELYKEVWNVDDQSVTERFLRHATYEGYRGLVVLNENCKTIGFSYGYTSLSGQYYNGLLAKALLPNEKQKWLADCFEFVELAIHPAYRKKGLGKLLVNNLLEEVENQTAILTTQLNNRSARSLYERLGWVVVNNEFYPTNHDHPYVIMGKELK